MNRVTRGEGRHRPGISLSSQGPVYSVSVLRQKGEVLWDFGGELVALLANFAYVLQTSECTCSEGGQMSRLDSEEDEYPRQAADSRARIGRDSKSRF